MSNSTSSAAPVSPAAAVPCPRCQKPLIDPKGLGWCQACGFCLSLADTEKRAVVEAQPAPHPVLPPGAAQGVGVPRWLCVMLVGCVLIGGATYAGAHYLKVSPLERAVLCSVQIGAGVLVMLVGQFIGLLRIAPEDSALSFKDAIFPFRLYSLVFKRLPRTAVTVYGGSWGLTAIIAAVILIGGLGHWFSYIPGSQKNRLPQAQKGR